MPIGRTEPIPIVRLLRHLGREVFGESQRFTGRAVVALAADPEMGKKSGQAFASRDLADEYGFRDVDGTLPRGPMQNRPRGLREEWAWLGWTGRWRS